MSMLDEIGEMARVYKALGNTRGADEASLERTGGTFNLRNFNAKRFTARITADRVGAAYGWVRVFAIADSLGAVTSEDTVNEDAAEGQPEIPTTSGDPAYCPAVEVNGSETVAEGSIVELWPAAYPGSTHYEFSASAPQNGGEREHGTFHIGIGSVVGNGSLPDWQWGQPDWQNPPGSFVPTRTVTAFTVFPGKRIRGIAVARLYAGPGEIFYGGPYGVSSQRVTVAVSGGSMTNDIGAFGDSSGDYTRYLSPNLVGFGLDPGVSFFISPSGVNTMASVHPLRFQYTNATGTNQDLSFTVTGSALGTFVYGGGQPLEWSVAGSVRGYYDLEDF